MAESESGLREPGRLQRGLSWLIRGERPAASHALLAPTTSWMLSCLLTPLLLLLVLSCTKKGPYGLIQWTVFTIDNLRRVGNPVYLPVLFRTLAFAGGTTLLCLLLGYPFAYFLTFYAAPKRRSAYLMLLMLPFWTSYLIAIYSWMIILGREGLVNNVLLRLHILSKPAELLNTPGSVVLGLTYAYLPFMILPIYSALEKMPKTYIEAAKDLGAGPLTTFFKVTLPLSLYGILAGSILTFIPCMGDFLTAEFLGGPRSYMLGNLIQNQFGMAQDWPFGATLSAIILLALSVGLFFYERIGEADEADLRSMV